MSNETARQKEARAQGKIITVLLQRGLTEQETQLINTMSEANIKTLIGSWFFKSPEETKDSFIVGVVFQHHNSACVPQWFSGEFGEWVWRPSKERTIKIDRTPRKIGEYCLSIKMDDRTIQENAKSTPMSLEEYWLVLYLLIINPELGRHVLGYELNKKNYYVMHVRLDDMKVVAIRLHWYVEEWCFNAYRFGHSTSGAGYIFLSFAAA